MPDASRELEEGPRWQLNAARSEPKSAKASEANGLVGRAGLEPATSAV